MGINVAFKMSCNNCKEFAHYESHDYDEVLLRAFNNGWLASKDECYCPECKDSYWLENM